MAVYPRQRLNLEFKDFLWLFQNLFRKNSIMDDDLSFLEKLQQKFKTKNIVLTPSATYSFYKILSFLNVGPKTQVVLPANIYPSFPKIVKLLGAEPIFIEMDEKTLNLDYNDLKKKDITGKIVLVPIHYGILPENIEQILEFLKEHNCKIIIDSVQYFQHDDLLLNNGDVIIYSFSRAKDLDLLGGGAVISKSKKLIRYFSKSLEKNQLPTKISLLKDILKYCYIYFFTNKIIFPVFTYPLLLLNSFIKKDAVASTPSILFKENSLNLKMLESSTKMCNLQFWLGNRKLEDIGLRIRKRTKIAKNFYDFINKNANTVSVPKIYDGNFYTFPIISKDPGLRKRLLFHGIDTNNSFLKDCSKQSSNIFSRVIHVPIYGFRKREYKKFKKNILKSLNYS